MNPTRATPTLSLTPKGALVAALGWDAGHRAWAALSNHAKDRADYAERRGTPAIAFVNGGEVVTVKIGEIAMHS